VILPEISLDRNRRVVVVNWEKLLFKWPCSPLLLLPPFTSCSPIQLGVNSMTPWLYAFDDVGTTLDVDVTKRSPVIIGITASANRLLASGTSVTLTINGIIGAMAAKTPYEAYLEVFEHAVAEPCGPTETLRDAKQALFWAKHPTFEDRYPRLHDNPFPQLRIPRSIFGCLNWIPPMTLSKVPKPGPAKLSPKSGLDEWLEQAKLCRYLPENVMKQLCEMVKECLMEGTI
jgi:hypothetical protein